MVLALIAMTAIAADKIYVRDAEDSSPLPGVSVFSSSGLILGATDIDGAIDSYSATDYPLTLKCMGYKPALCQHGQSEVSLVPESVELSAVTVTPADRPVVRVVCYVREYSSGGTSSDTVQMFAEHVGDLYYTTGKVKKFKAPGSFRPLVSRLYERHTDSHGLDSVAAPEFRDDMISWIDLVELPPHPIKESDVIAAGAATDTIQGKYGIKTLVRKTPSTYSMMEDALSDSKSHSMSPFLFKLLGMTIDITELQQTWAFKANDRGLYNPSDLKYGSLTMALTGKGKWIKKAFKSTTPVDMRAYFEIYPLRVEYLTAEEAREQVKGNPPAERFERSEAATPLPKATQDLVDRVNAMKRLEK